jgi:hypothetical protein
MLSQWLAADSRAKRAGARPSRAVAARRRLMCDYLLPQQYGFRAASRAEEDLLAPRLRSIPHCPEQAISPSLGVVPFVASTVVASTPTKRSIRSVAVRPNPPMNQSTATVARRRASFGKRYGLSLGGSTINALQWVGREGRSIEAITNSSSPGVGQQSPLGRRLGISGNRWRQTSGGRAVADTKSWRLRVANCRRRVRNTCQVRLPPGHAACRWEGFHASLGLRGKGG